MLERRGAPRPLFDARWLTEQSARSVQPPPARLPQLGLGLDLALHTNQISVLAIPSIGADESSARLVVQGQPEGLIAQRRAERALDHDLARLHDRAPEGWPTLASRTPRADSSRWPARAVGRGDYSARRRRRGPVGPKSGRRRPAHHGSPIRSWPVTGGSRAAPGTQRDLARRNPRSAASRSPARSARP